MSLFSIRPPQVIRNAVAASAQVFLSGVALFLLYYFLYRELGPVKLGVWSVVLASSAPARLSELGVSGGVTRFLAKYKASNDGKRAALVVKTAVTFVAGLMSAVLVLAYFLLPKLIALILPAESYSEGMQLLPFALFSLWISSLGGVFLFGLDGVLRADIRSLVQVAGEVLHLLAVVVFVPMFGLIGLGISQIVQATLVMVLAAALLIFNLPSLGRIPFGWNRAIFREMLTYGLNLQIVSISQLMFQPVTKVLISKFSGLEAVTHFEMANRMVTQVRNLLVAANQVLVPIFSGFQEGVSEEVQSLYRRSYNAMVFLSLPLFASLASLVPIISEVWVGHYESTFAVYSALLIIGWFLNTLSAPVYFSNLGTGNLMWNTISHIVIAVLNIGLGIWLGTSLGGLGVVVAFAVSLIAGGVLLVASYHRSHKISMRILMPREHFGISIASVILPAAVWWFFHEYGSGIAVLHKLGYGVILVLLIFVPLMLFHPLGVRLLRESPK